MELKNLLIKILGILTIFLIGILCLIMFFLKDWLKLLLVISLSIIIIPWFFKKR